MILLKGILSNSPPLTDLLETSLSLNLACHITILLFVTQWLYIRTYISSRRVAGDTYAKGTVYRPTYKRINSLVSAFSQKNKTYGVRCVCVCVKFWSHPNDFQTSYPIDTKFWLHIISYRNSPTPLIPFLNFEKMYLGEIFKIHFFSI